MLQKLRGAADAAGARFEVSPEPEAPAELARAAAARGDDLIACGGDGVVSVVAGVAADHGRRLAVVPTGSGNDFARVLGFDLRRPLDALRVVADGAGVDRTVDLGRVNGRWYTTVATSGFDSEVSRWARERRRLSGTALYVVAVLRTLAVHRPQRFRLTVGDEAHDVTAWLVAAANGPSYGGGMRIAPEARLDDGCLDVTVVGPVSKPGFVKAFPKVFEGTHLEHPQVQTFRGTTVKVEILDGNGDGSPGETWADGEPAGALPATLEAVPGALVVRAPAPPA
jgi:diacylglycerol kinase (ATP)